MKPWRSPNLLLMLGSAILTVLICTKMKSRLDRPFAARLQMALWREKTYSTLQRCCVCCVSVHMCATWLCTGDNYIIGPVVVWWTVLIGITFFTHICILNLVSKKKMRVMMAFSSLLCSNFNFKVKSLYFSEPRPELCYFIWANESARTDWSDYSFPYHLGDFLKFLQVLNLSSYVHQWERAIGEAVCILHKL